MAEVSWPSGEPARAKRPWVGVTGGRSTIETLDKARNVAANGQVGVTIPTRKIPGGPPYSIQFQGRAEIVAMDDPRVTDLVEAGRLEKITSHGELDEPNGVFVVITPDRRIHSYGIGVPVRDIIRDPIRNGPRSVLVG